MSDEIKTGEQALADGRGKIELPTVEEVLLQPLPQTTEDTKELIGATIIDHNEDGTNAVTHLPPEPEEKLETLNLEGADAKAFARVLTEPMPDTEIIDALA